MKKFYILAVATISVILFSACNKNEDTAYESYNNLESSSFTESSYTYKSSETLNIIEASNTAKRETDAVEIHSAVKTYQASIMGGSLNENNKPSSLNAYTLPEADASESEKLEYVNKKATLKEAMIYAEIWEELADNVANGEFGYNEEYGDYHIIANNSDTTHIIIIKDGDIPIGEIMKWF